jgi:hypothetical protein
MRFVDYIMTNMQNIRLPKIVGSVPLSNLWNPIKIIAHFIWQSLNFQTES